MVEHERKQQLRNTEMSKQVELFYDSRRLFRQPSEISSQTIRHH